MFLLFLYPCVAFYCSKFWILRQVEKYKSVFDAFQSKTFFSLKVQVKTDCPQKSFCGSWHCSLWNDLHKSSVFRNHFTWHPCSSCLFPFHLYPVKQTLSIFSFRHDFNKCNFVLNIWLLILWLRTAAIGRKQMVQKSVKVEVISPLTQWLGLCCQWDNVCSHAFCLSYISRDMLQQEQKKSCQSFLGCWYQPLRESWPVLQSCTMRPLHRTLWHLVLFYSTSVVLDPLVSYLLQIIM